VYLYPVDADEQLQLGGNQKCIFQLGTYPKASGKAAELEKPAGKCGVCWCGGRDNRRGLVRGAAMRSVEKHLLKLDCRLQVECSWAGVYGASAGVSAGVNF